MTTATANKFKEVQKLISEGSAIGAAAKKAGMPLGTYYNIKKSATTKATPKKTWTKKATTTTTPKSYTDSTVTVIVCSPNQLKSVLTGLQ